MSRETGSAETSWIVGIVAGGLVIILMVAAYGVGWSRGRDDLSEQGGKTKAAAPAKPKAPKAKPKAAPKPAPAGPGKDLFASKCGACHTLSAAGTNGAVGPNLDQLKADDARVLKAIEIGGTGSGAMAKNLYSGKQAEQVAKFVAQASGG